MAFTLKTGQTIATVDLEMVEIFRAAHAVYGGESATRPEDSIAHGLAAVFGLIERRAAEERQALRYREMGAADLRSTLESVRLRVAAHRATRGGESTLGVRS